MPMLRAAMASIVCVVLFVPVAYAQAPVEYRLSFPDYVRHVMDVEVVFREVGAGPVDIHMSRSSPGRYSRHEFARNVFDVQVQDGAGRPLAAQQPSLHVWRVSDHGGTVRVRYRVFGDRVDGTYLGVDATQAHVNMPAALMWARSLEMRPARITLVPPPDVAWTAATQLYPTPDPLVFTAPNLPYLMDSPVQLAAQTVRTFAVPPIAGDAARPAMVRVALHHDGTDADVDRYVRDVERIVREAQAVFGEMPAFEPGHFTFLGTYVRGADGDGMEHRNSTVLTSGASIRTGQRGLMDGVAHEVVHAWNVERIRPRSLEPFDFDEINVSTELWVGEGFTQYYGLLLQGRAGVASADETLAGLGGLINAVNASYARRTRFAPEMSRLAPYADGSCVVDGGNWNNTFLSYYTFGAAIALGLDLELRDRTDGRLGLDDYMRALWTKFGRTPGPPGTVATPYAPADLEATLAEVSGSMSFAREFFERYVNGPELVEYGMLLRRMGLLWTPAYPGRAWMGDLPVTEGENGAVVLGAAPMGTPAYDAGFGRGDVMVRIGTTDIRRPADLAAALVAAKPGDRLEAAYLRHGKPRQTTIALRQHPARALVPRERAGETPTAEELRMRASWLGARSK